MMCAGEGGCSVSEKVTRQEARIETLMMSIGSLFRFANVAFKMRIHIIADTAAENSSNHLNPVF